MYTGFMCFDVGTTFPNKQQEVMLVCFSFNFKINSGCVLLPGRK